MELAGLIREHGEAFEAKYGSRLTTDQRRALAAMLRCRTPAAGQVVVSCPECGQVELRPHSCGHRSCPKCQNHQATEWLERQQEKLLPCSYYLITFTLPEQLRPCARRNQEAVYGDMFEAASEAITELAKNPRFIGGEPGMTGILHTHTRQLEYHPHIHFIVPGGGLDRKAKTWRKLRRGYLLPHKILARLFFGKMLALLRKRKLAVPPNLPKEWVVDIIHAGSGIPALQYLSRYLYRGVVAESNILSSQDGKVTYRYRDGKTKETCSRTISGEDFLWLVIQHVLPTRFRRVRDYGFLHGRDRTTLRLIQLILHVRLPPRKPTPRPVFKCTACGHNMVILGHGQRTVHDRKARDPPTVPVCIGA